MRPDVRACSRTAAASRTGSRTVNTDGLLRDRNPAVRGSLGDVAAGLPLRAAQPPGQQPRRLSSRSPGLQQPGGLVDMRRVLARHPRGDPQA